jgi:hypothetical protein
MKAKNWLSLKPGNKLKLEKNKVRVEQVYRFTEQNKLCSTILAKVVDDKGSFYLRAFIVDDDVDVCEYNEMAWIGTGDRKRLIDEGNHPLFRQPENDNFAPADLVWAESMSLNSTDGKPLVYNLHRRLYGEVVELPQPSGLDRSVYAEITEFKAIEINDNPEVMFIELGGIDYKGDLVPTGGFVIPLEGSPINNDDVDTCWF